MRLVVAGLICLLAVQVFAQSDPKLARCVYRRDVPEQAVAEKLMSLDLPYVDKQYIYYRDVNRQLTGDYAVRRSLRIYFYDKQNTLIGTALRRSQTMTSYFDPRGTYLGHCINHKLILPNDPNARVAPLQK